MKKCVALLLALLLLAAMLAACASKQRDVYYGDVKLKWLDQPYEPEEITLDNEWLERKCREAAEEFAFATPEDFLDYLTEIEPMLRHFFMNKDFNLTGIVHFSNGIWGVRFEYEYSGNLPYHMLDGGDAYFYFREENGELYDYVRDLYGEDPWRAFLDE